jgi:hypothetical protein
LITASKAKTGEPTKVFLTRVGGGAFGNPGNWIDNVIDDAVNVAYFQNSDIIDLRR